MNRERRLTGVFVETSRPHTRRWWWPVAYSFSFGCLCDIAHFSADSLAGRDVVYHVLFSLLHISLRAFFSRFRGVVVVFTVVRNLVVVDLKWKRSLILFVLFSYYFYYQLLLSIYQYYLFCINIYYCLSNITSMIIYWLSLSLKEIKLAK